MTFYCLAMVALVAIPIYILFNYSKNPFLKKWILKREAIEFSMESKDEHEFLNATKMYEKIKNTKISALHIAQSNRLLIRRELELRKQKKKILSSIKDKNAG